MAARVADQAALGVAAILVAKLVGPVAFAPLAVLFAFSSLAIQIADFGVGLAVMRAVPGAQIARSSLMRVRRASSAAMALGLVAGAAAFGLGASSMVVAVVVAGGAVWALGAEVYIRKAAMLKLGGHRRVVAGELLGAAAMLAYAVVVVARDVDPVWFVLAFPLKQTVEVAPLSGWQAVFASDGDAARSLSEWLSQIVTYLAANADYAVLAVLLGPADLSRYVLAYRYASAGPAFLAYPLTQTTFLEMGEAGAADRSAVQRRLVSRGLLGGTGVAVVVVAASPLLPLVLGPDWSETGLIATVLAMVIPVRLLLGTAVATAMVAGRASSVIRWEAARLVATVVATTAGALLGGVLGAAVGVALTAAVAIPVEHGLAARSAGLRPDRRVGLVGAVAAVAAVAVAAIWA